MLLFSCLVGCMMIHHGPTRICSAQFCAIPIEACVIQIHDTSSMFFYLSFHEGVLNSWFLFAQLKLVFLQYRLNYMHFELKKNKENSPTQLSFPPTMKFKTISKVIIASFCRETTRRTSRKWKVHFIGKYLGQESIIISLKLCAKDVPSTSLTEPARKLK